MNVKELKEFFMENAKRLGWMEEAQKETARNFLLDGYPVESVAKNTSLPIETVNSLLQELQNNPS